VVGRCDGAPVSFAAPTATDACGVPEVTCDPVGGLSVGPNSVTCTARDRAGNTSQRQLTVNVLEPLQVAFSPPLADDNQAGPIESDADVANLYRVGQVIPHRGPFTTAPAST
jgi:hypothetical protein